MLQDDIRCEGKGCPLRNDCERTKPLPFAIRQRISYIHPPYNMMKEKCSEYIKTKKPNSY